MFRAFISSAIVCLAFLALAPSASAEAYGTFECMGVVVDVPAGHTAAQIGQVKVFMDVGGVWRRQQDAVQVGSDSIFASSVFGLSPGTSYDFKIEFYDASAALITTEYLSGATRAEISIPAPLSRLYVSPSGSDGAAGTIGAPFGTIAHAISVASAGAEINLRAGTYYEGELYPEVSGTEVAPIVIRAYNGEDVVLDGADSSLISTAWTYVQPAVYRHSLAAECWNVCLKRKSDGEVFRAYPMATIAEVLSQTSAGYTFAQLQIDAAYCADGANITVRVPSGVIGDYDVYVSSKVSALYLEGRSFIYVDGLTFTHYGSGSYGRGIYVLSSSDILIQNCRFLYNNSGIMVKNASSRVVIQDNVCVDDTADWHFGYSKSMAVNYSDYIETGMVVMLGTYSGRGLVVRRNNIQGTFDGSEIDPFVSFTGRTVETDFYDNTIYHVCDDFIELDGYSRNVRVFRNNMRECLSGISLAQALDGPTWIVRNYIIDCGLATGTTLEGYEGYPFKTNGGPHPEIGSGPAFFYHNTSYTSDPASRAILVKSNVLWEKFTFRNNIWCGLAQGFEKWSGPLSPMDFDYDCLYTAGAPYCYIQPTTYANIAAVRSALGWLVHGTDQYPQFVNLATHDYALASSSPCIDSGVVLPGIDEDFVGSAPDMGAFEYSSPAPTQVETPVFSPDPSPAYLGSVDVSISCGTAGAQVRYTTDGADPGDSSPLYSAPVHVAATTAFKARAFKSGLTPSDMASATYVISGTIAVPTFDPPAGLYGAAVDVTINCATVGATIHYTTGGGDPTSASPAFTLPLHLASSTTIKAIATYPALPDSAISEAEYRVDTGSPTVSNLAAVPTAVKEGLDLTLTLLATADDSSSGGSNIIAAAYIVSGIGGAPSMDAADGAFDSPTESLVATVDCSTWTAGAARHITVRAKDAAGHWSAAVSIDVQVVSAVPPGRIADLAAVPDDAYTTAPLSVFDVSGGSAPGAPAANLVDDDLASFWQSAGASAPGDESVTVDLGGVTTIAAVALAAGPKPRLFPQDFSISSSVDGSSWDVLASARAFKASARQRFIWQFAPCDARYVRILGPSMLDSRDRLFRWQIAEVEVPSSLASSAVTLSWTAPGDDGFAGAPATAYDIRYSASPIYEANFASCQSLPGNPVPSTPGLTQTATVQIDDAVGRLWVAMKAVDALGNWSTMSNVASCKVGGVRIVSLAPPDATLAASEVPSVFTFAAGALAKSPAVAISSSTSFPAKPVARPGGETDSTVSFAQPAAATLWMPSRAQWVKVKKTAPASGVLFWRLEGKAVINKTTSRLFGPIRSFYFDVGSITALAVSPSHDVAGMDAVWPLPSIVPSFSWNDSSNGMAKYLLDVSSDPDVPIGDRGLTVTIKAGTSACSPSAAEWKKIRSLAASAAGSLYWRVRALDKDNALSCASGIEPLLIDPGSWPAVSALDLSSPAPAVSWTHIGDGIVGYFLQFSVNDQFDRRSSLTIHLPTRPISASSYALTAADTKRIQAFAKRNHVPTLYYRVVGADADKAFLAFSPSQMVSIP